MKGDMNNDSKFSLDETHVIVVGGGAAGGVVAARLSERPDRNVLLIEAGPTYAAESEMPPVLRFGAYSEGDVTTRDFMWKYQTTDPAPGARGYELLTGKALGGGSSVNGQVWLRGLPSDFDSWAGRGARTWSWRDVEPWFAVSETDLDFPAGTVHGHEGPVVVRRFSREEWHPVHHAFYQACIDRGFSAVDDLNRPHASGIGAQPFNNHEGVRQGSAITHVIPAMSRRNLRVLGDTEVRRLRIDRGRALGVEAHAADGTTLHLNASDEVVVSAGAIGSPWLLMRSGIGPAEHLAAHGVHVVRDLPGVGQNLQDHPRVGAKWRTHDGVLLDPTAARYQVSLRTTAPGSAMEDDLKISMTSYSTDDRGLGVEMYMYLMLARSRGSVRLRSADPTVLPEIDFNFLRDDEDRRRMRDGVRLGLDIAESPLLQSLLIERITPSDAELADDDALDAWLAHEVQGTFHPSSTCAMGAAGDPRAVVDDLGRVHGVAGLRVVDASVFPESVRANLTSSIFMLAERISAAMDTVAGTASKERTRES